MSVSRSIVVLAIIMTMSTFYASGLVVQAAETSIGYKVPQSMIMVLNPDSGICEPGVYEGNIWIPMSKFNPAESGPANPDTPGANYTQTRPVGPSSSYPLSLTDDKGRIITMANKPGRIVSLSPTNTELLFALGLGDKVVGVTDYCNYPPEALNRTKVGGITNVNVEQVAALNPDIVFAASLTRKETAEKLDSMGYPAFVNDPRNLSDIEKSIRNMGKVCGADDNATRLINQINASMKTITDKTSALNESQKPTVLMLLDTYDFYVAGSNCYGDDLIKITGGKNVAYKLNDYATMNKEAIIKADPDIIVMPVDQYSQADFEKLRNGTDDWMKQLSAVKNGKVYAIASDPIFRPGPRVVEAAQAMAKIIHPELFP